mmetsp:Transcript_12302/g.34113  ORF Transcript_12302/g.34113 Transcript_12302/m.34113 type:complete len:436 (+) Transcript_12302:197-1504(+)|eukprot:CAMPEP_0168743462 /NCGR_PEP_ID=MMETSP0724-20121128/13591_1 /TAXON_ID=265536 /ORGANISM="Amphiprora sp., Strain CCMP467" /LENGTH=435 /DNA_ID=CAMNT_0008791097 /DNA_START=88 /DNA_END=1395 /DNA_ORIENTATION=+
MHPEGFIRTLQFGSNSGAGGVFLGTPDEDRESSQEEPDMGNNNNGDDDDDDGRSTAIYVRDILIILLIGVALIVTLVCSTYGFAYFSDRWCCCFPGFRPVTTDLEEFHARFDRGAVARKARLWGLTVEERCQILKAFFQKHIFLYNGSGNSSSGTNKKNVDTTPTIVNTTVDKEKEDCTSESAGEDATADESMEATVKDEDGDKNDDLEAAVTATTNQQEVGNDDAKKDSEKDDASSSDGEKEESEEVLDDADHERICCICLNEYAKGDKLMTGTQCIHKTHYECCMEWMKKHDHCPYCRKEMLTAPEMRQAAIDVLGEERVQSLQGGATVVVVPEEATTDNNNTAVPNEVQEAETTPADSASNEQQQTNDDDIEKGEAGGSKETEKETREQPEETKSGENEDLAQSPPEESLGSGDVATTSEEDANDIEASSAD